MGAEYVQVLHPAREIEGTHVVNATAVKASGLSET
jgi:hypothetical protein